MQTHANPRLHAWFWVRVDVRGPDECWRFYGDYKGAGFGVLRVCGQHKVAHHVAWELTLGPLPKQAWLDRLCTTPSCCNPSHYVRNGTTPSASRFWAKVDRTETCWLWKGGTDAKGYGRFGVAKRTRIATHVSWFLAHREWPTLPVLHHCDTPGCVRPEHLFLGTRAENNADMRAKGRHSHGAGRPNAKLTNEAVQAIRARRAAGEPLLSLAAAFGVSFQVISNVARRKTWRHVL